MQNVITLTRIEKVLDYIHEHLDEAINVVNLAEKSCWSRWQFQRVFGVATGLTVAQYVRELRLSKAAELLLDTQNKHIDIAMLCGFESEIVFSRAFKQMFECSPRQYRQRGKRVGLRTPLKYRTPQTNWPVPKPFTQIRIENRQAFKLIGSYDWIRGPFSSAPNFEKQVPQVWEKFIQSYPSHLENLLNNPIGVVDTRETDEHPEELLYWAGYPAFSQQGEHELHIPEQEYAVIPVHGVAKGLVPAIEWFLSNWLPESNYSGVSGFDLEIYTANYNPENQDSYMEYWVPVELRNKSNLRLF